MMQIESYRHPIIDLPDFTKEFSRHDDPYMPTELNFWRTLSDESKADTIKSRPNMWREGQGRHYLDALSRSRSTNSRNLYWLNYIKNDKMDDTQRKKYNHCLSTYMNMDINE